MTHGTCSPRIGDGRTAPVMMNAASGSWTLPSCTGSVPARVSKGFRSDDELCAELRTSFPDVVSIWRGNVTGSWWALGHDLNEFIEARTLEELGHLLWQRLGCARPSRRGDRRIRSRPGAHLSPRPSSYPDSRPAPRSGSHPGPSLGSELGFQPGCVRPEVRVAGGFTAVRGAEPAFPPGGRLRRWAVRMGLVA